MQRAFPKPAPSYKAKKGSYSCEAGLRKTGPANNYNCLFIIYKKSFFQSNTPTTKVATPAMPNTSRNPSSPYSVNGTGTLTPHKLKIAVGTAKIIVTAARSFMTMFKLLEIIELNAFIMFIKMLEYISTISMACLFSIITSSNKSSSSSYILRT